jgi:hypothetical protein
VNPQRIGAFLPDPCGICGAVRTRLTPLFNHL